MKIIPGNTVCCIMLTHLLILLLLLICVVQERMARHVPILVLLNEKYRPAKSVMSVENKTIIFVYDMMTWKCRRKTTSPWFPTTGFWQASYVSSQSRINRVRCPKFNIIWIYQYQTPLRKNKSPFHRTDKSSQNVFQTDSLLHIPLPIGTFWSQHP